LVLLPNAAQGIVPWWRPLF